MTLSVDHSGIAKCVALTVAQSAPAVLAEFETTLIDPTDAEHDEAPVVRIEPDGVGGVRSERNGQRPDGFQSLWGHAGARRGSEQGRVADVRRGPHDHA